jgi:hypothetical protein
MATAPITWEIGQLEDHPTAWQSVARIDRTLGWWSSVHFAIVLTCTVVNTNPADQDG